MKARIETLAVERLHELFTLENGVLRWKAKAAQCVVVGAEAGAIDVSGYKRLQLHGNHYLVHRIVFAMVNGRWPAEQVDHINGNKPDNRPENLREATHSQNMRNRKKHRNNTSGASGVRASRGKWRVQAWVDGKQRSFGTFADLELAELVRAEVVRKYHGPFVRLAA